MNYSGINSGSHSTVYISGLRACELAALLTRMHVYPTPLSYGLSCDPRRINFYLKLSYRSTCRRSDMTAM